MNRIGDRKNCAPSYLLCRFGRAYHIALIYCTLHRPILAGSTSCSCCRSRLLCRSKGGCHASAVAGHDGTIATRARGKGHFSESCSGSRRSRCSSCRRRRSHAALPTCTYDDQTVTSNHRRRALLAQTCDNTPDRGENFSQRTSI
jgi:hypothetical protein